MHTSMTLWICKCINSLMLMHKVKPVCIVVIAGIRIILHLDGTIKVSKITNFFHHFKHFDVEKMYICNREGGSFCEERCYNTV